MGYGFLNLEYNRLRDLRNLRFLNNFPLKEGVVGGTLVPLQHLVDE